MRLPPERRGEGHHAEATEEAAVEAAAGVSRSVATQVPHACAITSLDVHLASSGRRRRETAEMKQTKHFHEDDGERRTATVYYAVAAAAFHKNLLLS
jgi:hypothetical protein